jgi:thiol-disulfide isomerase/thioredoxin
MALVGLLLTAGCVALPPPQPRATALPAQAAAATPEMTAVPPEIDLPEIDPPENNQAAPTAVVTARNFSLPAVDGGRVSLRELRERWVIVNFWATWCAPCREEMPYLQSLADVHAADLTVLGINMREDAATLTAFLTEVPVTFPILTQPDDATLLWYGPRGLPLTYVIAPDGTVAYQQYGPLRPEHFDRWLAEQLTQ